MSENSKPAKLRTHLFARKTFYVEVVRVSEANIELVAEWSEGTLMTSADGAPFVKIDVHRPMSDRQTEAYIGDWVLVTSTGFKVYTPKAFDKAFQKVKHLSKEEADAAGIKVPHEPRPKGEKPKATQKGTGNTATVRPSDGPKPTPPKRRPKPPKKREPRVGHVGQALAEARGRLETSKVDEVVQANREAAAAQEKKVVKGTDNRVTNPDPEQAVAEENVKTIYAGNPIDRESVAITDEPRMIMNPDENKVFEEPAKSAADVEADKLIDEVSKLRDS